MWHSQIWFETSVVMDPEIHEMKRNTVLYIFRLKDGCIKWREVIKGIKWSHLKCLFIPKSVYVIVADTWCLCICAVICIHRWQCAPHAVLQRIVLKQRGHTMVTEQKKKKVIRTNSYSWLTYSALTAQLCCSDLDLRCLNLKRPTHCW